jgi:hypothetical protein
VDFPARRAHDGGQSVVGEAGIDAVDHGGAVDDETDAVEGEEVDFGRTTPNRTLAPWTIRTRKAPIRPRRGSTSGGRPPYLRGPYP